VRPAPRGHKAYLFMSVPRAQWQPHESPPPIREKAPVRWHLQCIRDRFVLFQIFHFGKHPSARSKGIPFLILLKTSRKYLASLRTKCQVPIQPSGMALLGPPLVCRCCRSIMSAARIESIANEGNILGFRLSLIRSLARSSLSSSKAICRCLRRVSL